MITDNELYYYARNSMIGTPINYDTINETVANLRKIPHIEDVRIGPPIIDGSKVNVSALERMIGLYVKGQVTPTIDLATAQAQLEKFYQER